MCTAVCRSAGVQVVVETSPLVHSPMARASAVRPSFGTWTEENGYTVIGDEILFDVQSALHLLAGSLLMMLTLTHALLACSLLLLAVLFCMW